MKDLPKAYNAKDYEAQLYEMWENSGAFAPDPDPKKEPYTIIMPPPNATGTLHLGHATMLALQDILIRYKRMQGFSTLWLPGTDHAGIATQSVVEKKLQATGMKQPRKELGREGLLAEIRTFVEQSKDTIRNQVRKMGASVDWSRERYTNSEDMNRAVNTLFKMMYEDGLIYRGDRIVNWDPKMQTTVADDELEYVEEKSAFYTFQYGPFQIGTSRPETKFGDKVVVMHPNDPRYKHYKNGQVIGPFEWINGETTATIIKDEAIDMEFGTGVMTITPWHDAVDFEIAEHHKLSKYQVIDLNGRLLPIAGEFAGMKIDEARTQIVEKMTEKGLLVSTNENYLHNVAVSYRGKGKVEPQIMKQWFVDVNKPVIDWQGTKCSIKEVLQKVITTKMIRIIPDRFEKTYFHWIDNLRDWCISRQIWWGHRIPVWYKGEEIVASETSPGEGWVQDEDTLDTWFSSGLWTFSTLGWPEKTPDLMKFAPSSMLETGYDILFFWVARMILMSTYALRKTGFDEAHSIPFKDVYLHGLIRDIRGKKMSKSHPETCIDPLDMIEKYGTDAVRLSLIIGATPGNDMRLYEEKIAGYRNFVNKIWNGARFVLLNLEENEEHSFKKATATNSSSIELNSSTFSHADKWILTRLNEVIEQVTTLIETYQFSEAGMTVYNFFWGEYCDWYVEMSKVAKNPAVLKHVLETLLTLLHPFMPFVTEALWQTLGEADLSQNRSQLMTHHWPKPNSAWDFPKETAEMSRIMSLVAALRSLRAEGKVDATKKIHAIVYAHEDFKLIEGKVEVVKRLANLGQLDLSETGPKIEKALTTFVGKLEIYLPLADLLDLGAEKIRLEKEINNLETYLKSLSGKLSSEGFTKNAPKEILDQEHSKLAETKQKLQKMKGQLEELAA